MKCKGNCNQSMKFFMMSLQHQAWHLQWMYCDEHGRPPFVQFNSPALHKACSNILIYFLIAGAITGSCVIMALLHTSPWKPSPYTVSPWNAKQRNRHYNTFLLQWIYKITSSHRGSISFHLLSAPRSKLCPHTSTI